MQSIFDLVTAQAIESYWTEIPNKSTEKLAELFPAKKQLGMELKYIKGRRGVPVEIRLSALDSKTMLRDRRSLKEISTKLPFFKEGIMIDEDLRQKLLMVIATGNQTYIDAVLGEIFADEVSLLNGARVSRERMRAQLISTGAINVANNGQTYTYDYGMEEYQKVDISNDANKVWSDTEKSDPIGDLSDWADKMLTKTGIRPTIAIMRSSTFKLIQKNKKVATMLYPLTNGSGIITKAMVLNEIQTLTGITVREYDDVYGTVGTDGKEANAFYFPENVVTLIPNITLGNTVFGTTPEEADLQTSPEIANVRIVDTGVAITTMKQADPVNVETKVSEMVMPSFEQADKVFIVTVAK